MASPLRISRLAHVEGFDVAADGGERRSELVGHVGYQLTFGLEGRFGLLLLYLERGDAFLQTLGHPIEALGQAPHFVRRAGHDPLGEIATRNRIGREAEALEPDTQATR